MLAPMAHSLLLLLTLFQAAASFTTTHAFVVQQTGTLQKGQRHATAIGRPATAAALVVTKGQPSRRSSRVAMAATSNKSTLTDETVWKIRFVMKGIETDKGKKVDEIFRIDANFLEEDGYEPPQGSVRQLASTNSNKEDGNRLKITKSYWQLSEDPNDRKDGLWVWGLFKEPLYPFLLLKLETDAIPLPSSSDDDAEKDFIKPLQLFAQINHRRDSERGVLLEATDLKVRQMETVKADVFGVAKIDLYEEVNVGTISIQPAVTVEK